MTSLLPLASYNLALSPFTPTQAIESDLPVTVHLTLAAIDPEGAIDDDEQPSTLRILKSSAFNNLDDESGSEDEDFEEGEESSEGDEDADKIEEDQSSEDDEQNSDEENEDDDEDDLEDEDDEEIEEYVVCTLSPKSQYQQTLDLTISPDEEVFFVVTGSYPIHLSGNFVEHPYDGEDSEFDSEEDDSEDEYDLSPDEDEIIDGEDFDINDLENESDVEGKIEELVEEDEAKKIEPSKETKKSKKDNKKRQVEETEEEESKPEPKETKKQKKAKEEKNVKFNKELEQGPTESKKEASAPKPTTKTLPGGVIIEDRTAGKGPTAKNGSKVGVRYIGKLKNGSVFDKNTSGKPFQFGLGKGEVIKGWDVGVVGMAVGGERRIVIPSKMAYGSKKLPGIPANSELTFDVKLVSLK